MVLYKYKSFSSTDSARFAIDSLKNKYLYFSRPSELNDPFDCQMPIDIQASEKETQEWIDRNKHRMLSGNKFSTIEKFNQEREKGTAQKLLQVLSKKIAETTHVLCLTGNELNEVMWGNYGGNYKGICIGYNIENLCYTPLKIVAEDIITKIAFEIQYNDVIQFEKVSYDYDTNHKVYIIKEAQSQIDNVTYSITHKKECWKYEEEYRGTFFDFDKVKYKGQRISTKLYYPDNMLSEIIFGYKLSFSEVEKIKKMIECNYSNNVNFYIIDTDLQNGKLKKIPI